MASKSEIVESDPALLDRFLNVNRRFDPIPLNRFNLRTEGCGLLIMYIFPSNYFLDLSDFNFHNLLTFRKKKQPSRMSVLWAAGNEQPVTFESNGKHIDFVADSEPLTLKENKEHDSKLINGGNVEDNSIVA